MWLSPAERRWAFRAGGRCPLSARMYQAVARVCSEGRNGISPQVTPAGSGKGCQRMPESPFGSAECHPVRPGYSWLCSGGGLSCEGALISCISSVSGRAGPAAHGSSGPAAAYTCRCGRSGRAAARVQHSETARRPGGSGRDGLLRSCREAAVPGTRRPTPERATHATSRRAASRVAPRRSVLLADQRPIARRQICWQVSGARVYLVHGSPG
jgi:hypothetical protein